MKMVTLSGRFAAPADRSPGRVPVALPACLLAGMLCMLTACSETSLTDAPIVDLSVSSRAPTVKPPPMAIPAAPGEVIYTVKKGDTLFHLAAVAGTTMPDLARWNGIDEHAPIFVGQQLRLQPPMGSAEAQGSAGAAAASAPAADGDGGSPAETVATPVPLGGGGGVETRALDAPPGVMAAPAPMTSAPIAAPTVPAMPVPAAPVAPAVVTPAPGAQSALSPPAAVPTAPAPAPTPPPAAALAPAATSGWIWPVDGTVTSKFDPMRKGIEIAAAEDAPVLAVADGTVSYVGSPRDYGNLVILKHGEDLLSVYAHDKTLLVKEGQTVRRGQPIATAGKTPGMPATLHFEVRRNSIAIDPLDVLPIR